MPTLAARLMTNQNGRAQEAEPSLATQGDDITQPEYEELARYRYAMRRFLRFSEVAAGLVGVTAEHYLLLLAIRGFPERPYATPAELAERLQLDLHGAQRIIEQCQAAGDITRRARSETGRNEYFELTPAGAQRLSMLARLHRDELRQMHSDLRPPTLGPA